MNKQATNAMAHPNWTGLTLAELIQAGRISPTDTHTIRKFVQEANEQPTTIEQAMEQVQAVEQIAATVNA